MHFLAFDRGLGSPRGTPGGNGEIFSMIVLMIMVIMLMIVAMLMMFLAKLLMIVAMVLVIIDRLALINHVHSNIIVDHNQVDSNIVDFHSHGVLGND